MSRKIEVIETIERTETCRTVCNLYFPNARAELLLTAPPSTTLTTNKPDTLESGRMALRIGKWKGRGRRKGVRMRKVVKERKG